MAFTSTPGATGEHVTYCRVCEALCGMVATVEDGRISKIRPDHDNPHSKGHICVKGPALAHLAYDEDRVTQPLKRIGGPGEFVPVSWDEALDDIAARLTASRAANGLGSFAMNSGNPPSMGWPSAIGNATFQRAIGCTRHYSPASDDISSVVLAFELMFGTHAFVYPDIAACDHLMIFGSNPLVSHGSLMIAPRFKEDLDGIAARGRVIVVDPRRSETARMFEHVPIMPDSDVWLLGAMIQVVEADGHSDRAFIAEHCTGWDEFARAVSWITPELASAHCGIDAVTIRALAHDFATTPRAAAMGRIGICRGSYSTLTNFLVCALNISAGKFHVEGGFGWGHGGSATDEPSEGISPHMAYGSIPSRVRGLPSVWGAQSSLTFLEEMITPGDGQIKSLLVSGANPVMSMPNGPQLPEGFAQLDLMVALDLYVTETTRHAHYILPVTTQLERDDINQFFMNHMVRPFAQFAPAVIPPVGKARPEFDILRDLAERMGIDAAFGNMTPIEMADAGLKAGIEGKDGLCLEKLKANPHGVMIKRGRWAFDFKKRIGHADGKIHFWPNAIANEIERLRTAPARNANALRFVNLRKLRSINSWMNNIDKLGRGDVALLLIHPVDAAARGIDDKSTVTLSSEWGRVNVVATVTDEMRPGCVAYPHGRGNHGGWRRANGKSGVNINQITPATADMAEQVSGMSYLEGFDVEVSAL